MDNVIEVSDLVKDDCCGTTCDKSQHVSLIKEMENRIADQQAQIDALIAENKSLEFNRERTFKAGFYAKKGKSDTNGDKAWQMYRAENFL